jgi:hypothetical protein
MRAANFEMSSVGHIHVMRVFPQGAEVEYVTLLLKPVVDKRNRLQGFFEAILDIEGLDGMFPRVEVENTMMLKRVLSGLADRKEIIGTLRKLGIEDPEVIYNRLLELNLVKGAVPVVKPRGRYKDVVVELWGDETEEHGVYTISLERQKGEYVMIERENNREISRRPQPGITIGRTELRDTVALIEKLEGCRLKLFVQN